MNKLWNCVGGFILPLIVLRIVTGVDYLLGGGFSKITIILLATSILFSSLIVNGLSQKWPQIINARFALYGILTTLVLWTVLFLFTPM